MNKILLKTNIGEYNKNVMIKRFEKQIIIKQEGDTSKWKPCANKGSKL